MDKISYSLLTKNFHLFGIYFLFGCSSSTIKQSWYQETILAQSVSLFKFEEKLDSLAKPWLGVPYLWGGDTKSGVDCSGLTKQIIQNGFGIVLPRTAMLQYQAGTPIADSLLQQGDLVFFGEDSTHITHVGIYWRAGWFLNATTSRGVQFSHWKERQWERKYRGARRFWESR